MKYDDKIKEGYKTLYAACEINAADKKSVEELCTIMLINKPKYEEITKSTGVPWYVIAVIHNMEASLKFDRCLHNGEPWNKVTTLVPKGRGPWKSFEEAAIDALNYDGLASWTDWSLEGSLFRLEAYNGWGYRSKGINSPYLWSKTNQYVKGKYVADNKYDPNAVSDQIGCAAIFKGLRNVLNGTGIQKLTKGANISLAKNFNQSEFDCKCTRSECKETRVDMTHIKKLQEMRDKLGKPIHINCGFRCPEHNLEVGGVKGSQHQVGTATDITIPGMTPQEIAQAFNEFDGVGIYSNFIHIDSRGYHARWNG